MLKYKIDVIETLKESGYNSTRILKENVNHIIFFSRFWMAYSSGKILSSTA